MTSALSAQDLLGQLEAGLGQLTTSEDWARWLQFQGKFHQYSFSNCLLIATQRPEASQVAGYGAWQSLGRQVRKGEKAIRILAPRIVKGEDDERAVRGFLAVNVFDVEQTDGDPVPEPCQRLTGAAPNDLIEALTEVAKGIEFRVEFRPITAPNVNGFCEGAERLIVVASTNDPAQRAKTLVHEIAHALLHAGPDASQFSRSVRELEAESIAFVVSAALGLDTSSYSFGYVASWAGGDSDQIITKVKKSGARIQKTAERILNDLDSQDR